MGAVNKAILIGNLTRDPEARTTTGGIACTTFTLAINRRFANQGGEREADFIPIVTWRQTAGLCAQYLQQGRKCAVVGTIQTRSYTAQDGGKRYVTEVVADEVEFIGSVQGGKPAAQEPPPTPTTYDPKAQQQTKMQYYADGDDDLPF